MDLLNTHYDTTPDSRPYMMVSSGSELTTSQFQAFVSKLLSSLDIADLGAIYQHQLTCYLPLSAFALTSVQPALVLGAAHGQQTAAESIRLPLHRASIAMNEQFANYYFTRSVTRGERKLLEQLHTLFTLQLAQAIAFNQLKLMATKDTLTGLGNRNGFNEACNRLLSRAIRYDDLFALLIIDLDNFKQVNDTLGHKEGDKVLECVAQEIRNTLRGEDAAFRFGGDEFCCLLDCVDQQCIDQVAARLQRRISGNPYLLGLNISCSIGGTVYSKGDDTNSMFDRADKALYQVKSGGKNAFKAA